MSRKFPQIPWQIVGFLGFLYLAALLSPTVSQARDLEVGIWNPVWMGFSDHSNKVISRTGGGISVILPSSFGFGFDSIGAKLEPRDASSDAPQVKHNLINLSFTILRKDALDLTLGFGVGTVAYSCLTCAINYKSGKSSQLFLEGRGHWLGLEWALGLHKVTGLIKGQVLGPGNKVLNKAAGFTAASLGLGLGFK